ncbi:MAG: ribosome biogenesis GTPase Der [Bacteroidia bacterium]|nr:ribosome biogenesis GTPase Der [Bacteroidia bacterium]
MSAIVAIIGRPNVGKSTLFNRLIEEKKAITDNISGVTRDRNYGKAVWNGREFNVIDTGGYVTESEDVFEAAIREQVHIAMDESDVLLFVVDITVGVTLLDETFAEIVRRSPKKVIMVANKADSFTQIEDSFAFYELGLGEIYAISAMTGSGTGELLDRVMEILPPEVERSEENKVPRFAVVGKPNVGKSSFINALLDKNVNIVTPIAGTTRDSVHTLFNEFGHEALLVDTAGLRKQSKVKENLEFYSTLRTIKAIEECDVAILMIDASIGIESQDLAIFGMAQKNKKGIVIVVNKWDLVEKETNTARDFEKQIKERLKPFDDVPVIFTSTISKQRLLRVLEIAEKVYQNKEKKISTSELNEVMLAAIAKHHPPAERGRIIRIKYVTQIPAGVPTFLFFCNHPKYIVESYKRYLENQLRDSFDFTGVPINIFFREK